MKPADPAATYSPFVRGVTLINACLGQFMCAADARSVTVALPSLGKDFHAPVDVTQWVALAYQLTLVGLVLSIGRLGDAIGRKKIYFVGQLVFLGGCVLCASAGSMSQLLFFRVVEALGGAAILANSRAIITSVFPVARRGWALGMSSTAFHLGYMAGPSIAGLLIGIFGWRSVFLFNLPAIAMSALLTFKAMPETSRRTGNFKLDLPGMMSLLAAVVTLVLGMSRAAKVGFNGFTMTLLLAAVPSMIAFVWIERRVKAPLLDLEIFKIRAVRAGVIGQACMAVAQTGTVFLLPFYLQGLRGYTPAQVGLTIMALSVVVVLMAPTGGVLSDRVGAAPLCLAGSVCMLVAIAAMTSFSVSTPGIAICAVLALMGLGWALFAPPNLSQIFSAVPTERLGAISGITMTAANVANSIGVSLSGLLLVFLGRQFGGDVTHGTTVAEWSPDPTVALNAFHVAWAGVAVFAAIAVFSSLPRGAAKRAA